MISKEDAAKIKDYLIEIGAIRDPSIKYERCRKCDMEVTQDTCSTWWGWVEFSVAGLCEECVKEECSDYLGR